MLKPISYLEHGYSPATMRRGVLLSRLSQFKLCSQHTLLVGGFIKLSVNEFNHISFRYVTVTCLS